MKKQHIIYFIAGIAVLILIARGWLKINTAEIIFDEIFRAFSYLLVAGIVLFAWALARDNAIGGKTKTVLWKGFLWCVGIAFVAGLTLGDPSCIESDPLRGGCYEYADDGHEATIEERAANLAYFLTLLYIPVVLGAFNGGKKSKDTEKLL